jgi:hypothetical protein
VKFQVILNLLPSALAAGLIIKPERFWLCFNPLAKANGNKSAEADDNNNY